MRRTGPRPRIGVPLEVMADTFVSRESVQFEQRVRPHKTMCSRPKYVLRLYQDPINMSVCLGRLEHNYRYHLLHVASQHKGARSMSCSTRKPGERPLPNQAVKVQHTETLRSSTIIEVNNELPLLDGANSSYCTDMYPISPSFDHIANRQSTVASS